MIALTRRQFAKAAGALVVSFTLRSPLAQAAEAKLPGSLARNRMLDGCLRLNADGSATIRVRWTSKARAKRRGPIHAPICIT